jgi:hypothetical protein
LVLLSASLAVGAACAAKPALPGALGFGVDTPAGRGGRVIRVTSLKGSGPGTLREALESKGRRIVVFELGGVIDLEGKSLRVTEPYLTIAGETAPSPGVTIIRGPVYVSTHDVLVRHVRVRPGDAGRPKRSGWEPDGLSTSGADAHHIVVDHCSFTWAVDENLSASGPRLEGPGATSREITFSNNIIAECLSRSTHAKGEHSKGTLVHDCCTNIAVIGNLYAHNTDRNPYFKAHTTGVVVNNLIYNPGRHAVKVSWVPSEWRGAALRPQNCRIAVVGNVLVHGRDTRRGVALVGTKGDVYLKDNLAFDREGRPAPLVSGGVKRLEAPPVWPEGLEPCPAAELVERLLPGVGARPADRDEIDRRIVSEFRERTGRIIDSQDEVGGYPAQAPVRRPLVVPETGVGEWLQAMARKVEGGGLQTRGSGDSRGAL